MKTNSERMPGTAAFFALFAILLHPSPGMGLSKETQVRLSEALKESETELKTLRIARAKDRKTRALTQTAAITEATSESANEKATEAR